MIENEKQERIVEIAGDYVSVDISKWHRREDMQVDVSLGYGDTEREAMKWMMIHQMLAADPAMQSQYGPEQRFTDHQEDPGAARRQGRGQLHRPARRPSRPSPTRSLWPSWS